MSEAVIISIVTAVSTVISTIFVGVMAYLMAKLNRQPAVTAEKVAEVAVN